MPCTGQSSVASSSHTVILDQTLDYIPYECKPWCCIVSSCWRLWGNMFLFKIIFFWFMWPICKMDLDEKKVPWGQDVLGCQKCETKVTLLCGFR